MGKTWRPFIVSALFNRYRRFGRNGNRARTVYRRRRRTTMHRRPCTRRRCKKTARSVGLKAAIYRQEANIGEADLLALIDRLNDDVSVFGILLMMPLPESFDSQRIINRIDPSKDVDGLTDANIARLYGTTGVRSRSTPRAVMAILDYYHLSLSGKEVVIGRSTVVGKPLSQLCLQQNATVTVCHSRTKDLKAVCQRADVIMAAAGRAGLVTGDMIKPALSSSTSASTASKARP